MATLQKNFKCILWFERFESVIIVRHIFVFSMKIKFMDGIKKVENTGSSLDIKRFWETIHRQSEGLVEASPPLPRFNTHEFFFGYM